MEKIKVIPGKALMRLSYPRSYDLSLASGKGLLDDKGRMGERYCLLQTYYKKILCKMLLERLPLEQYEQQLLNAPYAYVSAGEKEKNIYEYFDLLHLEYIYLRNNVHIEKLSEEHLSLLEKYAMTGSLEEEVYQMVNDTFREAIAITDQGQHTEKQADQILYAETLDQVVLVPYNALVFTVHALPKFIENNGQADYIPESRAYLIDFCKAMQEELNSEEKDLFNIPIVVFAQ